MKPRATLLLGPARAGKMARLVEQYAAACAAPAIPGGSPPRLGRTAWIAPTGAAAAEVRDALAERLGGACLAPGATTFAAFAAQMLTVARARVRPLGPIESRRLVELAIAEERAGGRLNYFAAVADSPGFAAQVAQFIAEAKRRDAWAEDLQKQARGPREQELARLYGRYQRQLAAAGAFDAEGLFWAARDAAKRHSGLLDGLELVVVAGFHDFTAAQHDILQLIAKKAGQTVVELTLDEPTLAGDPDAARADLFAKSLATRQALRDRIVCREELVAGWLGSKRSGAPSGRSLGARSARPQPPSAASFVRIAEGLFGVGEAPPGVAATGIEIVAAPSVQREFDEVARRVKRLLLAGVAAEEVVVALRSTSEHARRLEEVFADHGVPIWLDARPPLGATPLVRWLQGLVRLHAEDWPYRQLLATVGLGQIRWGDLAATAGVEAAQTADTSPETRRQRGLAIQTALERSVRAAQVASGAETLLAQLRSWIDRADEAAGGDEELREDAVARADAARLALPALAGLAERFAELPRSAPLAEWVAALERLARGLGLLAGSPADEAAWSLLSESCEAILRADELAEHAGRRLSLVEFGALLASVGAQTSAPGGRDATGRVRIVGADRARHLRPRHLFLAGLSEQSFPAPLREDRQASERRFEELLAALDEPSSDQPTPAVPPAAGEMLLFYQLATRPIESLTLSYPALDEKAQPLPPSPYVAELVRCFAGGVPRTEISLGEGPGAAGSEGPAAATSLSESRRSATAAALSGAPGPLASLASSVETAAAGRAILAGLEAIGQRAVREAFGPFEGILASDAARAEFAARFGPAHYWSPSQLESYALCPFKFFAEKVLALESPAELTLESDVGRRGVLLHNTLAELHRRRTLDAAGEPRGDESGLLRDELVDGYRRALQELSRHAPRSGLDSALYEIERRQIDSWAEQLADQELQYRGYYGNWDEPPRPRYFEARFGPGSRRSESDSDADLSTDMPYELAVRGERLKLTGQIDRIDVGRIAGRTAFNVIDYKTSATAAVKAEQIADGRQLQLPLYAMAAEDLLLAAQDAVAWSAGYWSVQGRGLGKPGNKGGPLQAARVAEGALAADPTWEATREQLLVRVAELVAGIRRAEFPVFSADEHCTKYCPMRTVCRVAHVRSLQKTWQGAVMTADEDSPAEEQA
ncbi:MAG: PD-(D/E)XK nuclease family protein [Pirellulales bacterium]|nr:PD-(D/E)XK nuclease family protein [Pirellulales bacterium]